MCWNWFEKEVPLREVAHVEDRSPPNGGPFDKHLLKIIAVQRELINKLCVPFYRDARGIAAEFKRIELEPLKAKIFELRKTQIQIAGDPLYALSQKVHLLLKAQSRPESSLYSDDNELKVLTQRKEITILKQQVQEHLHQLAILRGGFRVIPKIKVLKEILSNGGCYSMGQGTTGTSNKYIKLE
jgi:hypothetical protein